MLFDIFRRMSNGWLLLFMAHGSVPFLFVVLS